MREPITAMIVDDESLERLLISKLYDWEGEGFCVSTAQGGREALEKFRDSPAELVLTDINMPFVNGLALSEKIREISPDTEIIIISGFNEFDYARKSINIGVISYLLKPISKDELKSAVEKARQRIEKRREEKKEEEILVHIERQNGLMPEFFQKVVEYVDENFHNPDLNLKHISAVFFLNESYLSRTFRAYLNRTFSEYILEKRMECAIGLVRGTAMKNYEIAEKVGILDPNYFGQLFKKYTGETINEFKKAET